MTTPYWPDAAKVVLEDWGASATATEGTPHMSGKVLSVNADGTWEYDEDTVLQVLDRDEPFHHTDRHVLHKVGEPTPNPLARKPLAR